MSANYEEAGHETAPDASITATLALIKISDSDSAASNENYASKMNDTAQDVDPSSTAVKSEPEDTLPPMEGIAFWVYSRSFGQHQFR
ncbi:uncharacterized protein TrAtP1_010222 [Trichoderma atroviride]|uniref:uncharacterized protein n=1 Tax=Hypocrea atroviridis TaxID=63577 RepID=UPI003331E3A9|nr:hypothetical protein TrAtP1_010222 [Trichoderma atroviride]